MKNCLLVAVFAFTIQGNAFAQTQPTEASTSCPANAAQLDILKTEKQVTNCLGQSKTTTSNPDGRHTALYRFKDGIIIVFLFDTEGTVIRHSVYQDSNAK